MRKLEKGKVLIEIAFRKGPFKMFLAFAKEKGIRYVGEIDMAALEEFSQKKGVGSVKMFSVIERLAGPLDYIQEELFPERDIKNK
ncbi:hypothetical protein [Isobaculum melis]|uniref:Uncharacterized protein n=1 Tax=Isobaculum melis TaxID=142588 RepID=A0A1H9RHD6_9LACT|nr:hypothetical protein [Isobaculum melis]SER72047.1 hypothetical protein SAMN04488559_10434 [Isobaculum melis]